MFENLFSTTTATVKPKTKMFEGIFNAVKIQPVEEEPMFKTVSLPEHLGGGEYKTAGGGTLLKTPRSYGDMPTKEQEERDHIISVALGGTSNKVNLQYLKTTNVGRQEGKVSVEQAAINDYLDNKISLPEARAKIAQKQQEIKGLIPKQGAKNYFAESFKNIFKSKETPFVSGLQEGFFNPFKTVWNFLTEPKKESVLRGELNKEAFVKSMEKIKYPEYAFGEIDKQSWMNIWGATEKKKLAGKKLTAEEEEYNKIGGKVVAEKWSNTAFGSATPMRAVDDAVAKELIKRNLVKQASNLTRKDLMDITTNKITSGIKYDAYQAISGDKNFRSLLSDIAKNKKVPLTQKIYDNFKSFFDPLLKEEVKPTVDIAEKFLPTQKTILPTVQKQAIQPLAQEAPELYKAAQKAGSAEEFVKGQPKLYHGSNQPITEFKSANQLRQELGDKFIPSNIGGGSKFTYFTEDPKLAKHFASARAFNVEGAGGIPTVTEGFVKGKIIDLSKDWYKVIPEEAKLFNQLADALEKKSTMFVEPSIGRSSGIGGADGVIIGELRMASKRAGRGMDSRRININFNDLDRADSAFADVLKDFNISGFKFGDKDTIGRFIQAQAILPETVKTKSQLTDFYNQATQAVKEVKPILGEAGFGKLPSFMVRSAESIAPIKHQDTTVQTIFKKWTRELLIGEQKANDLIVKIPKVSDNFDTILKYEQGIKIKSTEIIKKEFDTLFNQAKKAGVDVGYKENYIPQVYQNTLEEVKTAMTKFMESKGVDKNIVDNYVRGIEDLPKIISNRLKLNPSFSKERAFPDYATAIKFGLTPRYKEPAQLLSHYALELEKTIANRKFLDSLVKNGRLKDVFQAGSNWQAVNLPFSPKGYYAEPQLARMLNGIFRNEEMLGATEIGIKYISEVAKTMQEIVLSAGIPKTNVNFFAIGMGLVKELTAGNFKAVINFIRSNFNQAAIEHFAKNKEYLTMMARQGIDMSNTIASHKKIYAKIGDIKGFSKKLGFIWDKTFQEKTFNNLMPMNYLDTFKGAYKKALKKMPAEQAEKLAGNTVRAYHGLYENVGRGKGTEDILSAAFFAPKFREGLILTLFNTAKSATTEIFNPAFSKNRQLIAGMILTFLGYNALNKKLTGHYIWENPAGKEFELMIPTQMGVNKDDVIYIPFMPSFLAFPRNIISGGIATVKGDIKTAIQKFGSLASMPIKLLSELWANKDYFGREIYDASADAKTVMKDMAGYIFGINKKGASGGINHPFIREIYNQIFTEKPLYQSISEALEIPLKFSTMTKIQEQEFYEAVNKKAQEVKEQKEKFRPTYDEIQSKVENRDIQGAETQLGNLTEEEYGMYKSLLRSDKTAENRKIETKIFNKYQTIIELRDTNPQEAQKILDSFTEEEYKAFERLKIKFK